jgi:sensor histidine kinase regulating citrate/malate metabolism
MGHLYRPAIAFKSSYLSGLGFMIKETVKGLGCSIEIESSKGEYTIFIIKLPNKSVEVPA